MKNFIDKIKKILLKIRFAIFSFKGLIISGIISAIYLVSMAVLLINAILIYNNPSTYCGKDFKNMRNEIITNGTQYDDLLVYYQEYGSNFYGIEKIYNNEKYYVYVSGYSKTSNYIGIMNIKKYDGYGLAFCFTNSSIMDDIYAKNRDYAFYAQIVLIKEDGTPYTYSDILNLTYDVRYSCNEKFETIKQYDLKIDDMLDVNQDIIDEINNNSDTLIKEFLTNINPVIETFNVNSSNVLSGLKKASYNVVISARYLIICALISLFGGFFVSIFLLALVKYLKEKKRKKLSIDTVETKEIKYPIPKERTDPFEIFVSKTHLKPILNEWVIRGLGFIFIVVSSIVLKLIKSGSILDESNNIAIVFNNINTIGSFLLVIALVGIISETGRKLTNGTMLFITLAVIYYFAVNSFFFAIDCINKIDLGGLTLSSLFSTLLPGNIFMSIGMFTFIGFFLFEEPEEWFINRKLFRSLSIIPASIALLSVVLSILWTSGTLRTYNYWISSFFFIRNFDGLFVGILFEFTLFAFRSIYNKKYGKENAQIELEKPHNQFKKNVALCIIVLLYVLIFYLLPYEWKKAMVSDKHTYVYLMIPLFLFYKPSGKNYKPINNVIYYALYITVFAIPALVVMIFG